MSHNKTRQLARALRLNRSTSFSSSYVPPVSLSFGQHFASTRPISPTSSTSSTYSKDYGYSSSQSYPYSSSTSSSSYLEVRPQKSLHRHSSFNPSDYRPKYFPNESSIYKEPKLTSQYNKDVKLSNSNYSSDTINYDTKLSNNNYTNIQSNTTTYLKDKSSSDYMNIQPKPLLDSRQSSSVLSRRSIFTKCRRSSSLMSRYKPKSLRFADDTPCILSIYVAEPNKTSRLVYPKKEELEEKEVVKGILKTPNEDFYVNDEYEQESDVEDEEEESASDDNYKPPVIPRTLPPATLPKSTDQFQNGAMTNLKDATFGSTADSHYKALYEKSLEENERLRKQIDDLKYGKPKEPVDPQLLNGSNIYVTARKNYNGTNHSSSGGSHSPSPTATQSTGNSMDDMDRRAYERKISELEYELQNARHSQSETKRLKEENAALIRVISKLSNKNTGTPQTKSVTSNGSK